MRGVYPEFVCRGDRSSDRNVEVEALWSRVKRLVSHPLHVKRGIATSLGVGLVFLGCSDVPVILGWNAADAGAPPPFDGSQDAPAALSQAFDGSQDGPAALPQAFDGSPDSPTGDAGNAAGPSCKMTGAGLTDCGSAGESCCASPEVPAGTYYRTYTNTGGGPTGEADLASVSRFRLDKYLVTVGRFRQFVAAWNGGAGWVPPAGSGKHTHVNGGNGLTATGGGYETGWMASDDANIAPTNANLACTGPLFAHLAAGSHYGTWTPSAGSQESMPITCVNWFEAYAFCIWDGGFLPSEAEFGYVAAGGSDQRAYPWGSTDPGAGYQYAVYACYYPSGSGTCTGVVNIAPVGTATLGAGLWGHLDLAGTLWEWNLDFYAPYVNPCADCADLTPASARVTQGGNFNTGTSAFPPLRHANNPADQGAYAYGVRCARAP
jgi:sulfatase modifying factor 1